MKADTTTDVRALVAEERFAEAWEALRAPLRAGDAPWAWTAARQVLRAAGRKGWVPPALRSIRLAILCTSTADDLAEHVVIACRALGVDAELHVAPYGQLEQEVLAPGSGLAEFAPTHVLVSAVTADLGFPELAEDPAALLDEQEARWRRLWTAIADGLGARVVQHGFVPPDETALGHLAFRLPGSRPSLVRALNARLAAAAGDRVLLVDCDRLAARFGTARWTDLRLWHAARQPVSYEALPLLARETAAVLAADVGLAARCLVVDLDDTLWGGIVAEEGPLGVAVGEGPAGEGYAAFQEHLRALAARGIVLAVASKNDAEAAREPFERHPGMRLRLEDFAAFVADWRRKPEQIREIADTLGLPLEALVFADDNPAECAEVAAALPEVDTIPLTMAPAERVRALADSPRFEASALAAEDRGRAASYRARAETAKLQEGAGSLEDFWRSLDMRAQVRQLTPEGPIDRAAQLTQKTNQFNLTMVRRSREEVRTLAEDPGVVCLTLELEDRFARHGLIGLAIAVAGDEPGVALVDTLLLSCRVIGRTAETHLLSHLARAVQERGFARLRGRYVAGPRNALVADLYPRLGFAAVPGGWEYDLAAQGPIETPWIADA